MDNEMQKYSGEEFYRRPQRLDLYEIGINGQNGTFKKGKSTREGWQSENLDEKVSGVFLRVRKVFKDFKSKMWTPEFNVNSEDIKLYQGYGKSKILIDSGKASDIRAKHKELHTHQIVYFMLKDTNEVVRLVVRGASFGSQNKAEDTVSFYDYLALFKGDEHVWQFYTNLLPVKETSPLGTYYAINFERGEQLNELQLQIVKNESKTIHESFEAEKQFTKKEVSVLDEIPVVADEQEENEPDEIGDVVMEPKDDLPF